MNTESKRWVLLDRLPHPYCKRLSLILFLYSLGFALLLVGLRMFCHNLEDRSPHDTRNAPESHAVESQEMHSANILGADTAAKERAQNIQQNIADNIIRLHVIANSDSTEDQTLKLKVRDEVLSLLQTSLMQAGTQADAEHILEDMIPAVQNIATAKILAEGYSYPARVTLEQRYFPAKTYGDLTFPPGTYQALCVEIGTAQGKNWWCVLFPALCFVDETTAEVPETSKETLENSLSAEAYDSLSGRAMPTSTPAQKPEFHSAIYDWIRQH